MKPSRKVLSLATRGLVAILLLIWIFHAIFVNEGKLVAASRSVAWDQLSRTEQWHYGWNHGPPALWATLTSVEPLALALSVILMGLTIVIGILRWRVALQVLELDLPLGRAAEISFVAHFFNSFLLGSTGGDLMKAYYAARETHHRKTEAVVTVFVDRVIGLWSMLLFGAVMMLPNLPLLTVQPRLHAVAGFFLLMTGGCTGLAFLAFWGGVSRAWTGARHWLHRLPKGEWVERSLESCRQFGRARGFIGRVTALSMLLNVVCVMQFWVLAQGLHLNLSPVVLMMVVPIVICVAALPITPAGLGVRENLFVFMLATPFLGVADTSALALSLLAYAGSLFWSLVGGVVYLLFKEKHHLSEMKAPQED